MRVPVEPVIIGALNHLLAAQSWAMARLQPHAGDTIRLELGPTLIEFSVTADGLLEAAGGRVPAVTIGVPLGVLQQLLARDPQARRSVSVTGNAGIAADLEYLFANLRWDIEADLSRVVGDIAAHRIGRAGRAVAGLPESRPASRTTTPRAAARSPACMATSPRLLRLTDRSRRACALSGFCCARRSSTARLCS
jgi:ubiquinone biosynthesis protein UbiJ